MPAEQQQPDLHALFNEAIACASNAERALVLDEACGNNVAARQRIEALLRAHSEAGGFLGGESPGGRSAEVRPITEKTGTSIGPYTLVEQIGEGGFGVVFMAQQIEPVRRSVALKILKPGMDTRQVIARFEAERQALAMMDHPNIAKVFDAGSTESGRPYFAMELVQGVPVTGFCDERRLPPRERLELFVSVCQAVQHAHQKGVIHRDLKPSNVLVALYDSRPVPKVIDFGVAKAVGQPLTEKTLATGLGALVGTPQYMSPEQAELDQLDIDTRSDIYSLGVLLYELLTGTTPLQKKRMTDALLEVLRLVREEDPPKPSTRLSTAEELPGIAASRGLEPKRLSGLVRGDLDWIVMKCLEKDRNRRYETADGLARDIERYLRDEPVEASPPAVGYRLGKFLKRNRGRVTAVALVLSALLAGTIGTTWGMMRAEQARRDAVAAWAAEAERAAGERRQRERAQTRLTQIQKGTEILAGVFADLDPMTAETAGVTFRDLLCRRLVQAAEELEGEAVGDSLVMARLQHVLGSSLFEMGYRKQAEKLLVEAARTRERMLGADHLETAATRHHLAMLYREQGEYALAEKLYKDALAVRTARLGAEHVDTAATKHHLAMLYVSLRDYTSAEALLTDVLASRTAALGADHPDTLTTQHRLATLYRSQGKYTLSETLHKDLLEIRSSRLGADHLDTVATKGSLATLYRARGEYALAEALVTEVLAIRTAKLGADHPDTLSSRQSLANLHSRQGNYGVAEPLLKQVLAIRTATLGADHHHTLSSQHELARLYQWQGKFALAEPLYKDVLAFRTTRLGAGHLETVAIEHDLAALYQSKGNVDLAEALYKDVLASRTAALGIDHPNTVRTRDSLALLYQSANKPELTIPLLEESLKLRKAQLDAEEPELLARQVTLGASYCDAGRFADGIALIERVRERGRQDPHPAWVRSTLLKAYVQAGQTTKATALVMERVRDARGEFPAETPELATALADAGKWLLEAMAHAGAEPLYEEALAVRTARLGADHPDTLDIQHRLAMLYWSTKKLDKSIPLFEETLKRRKNLFASDDALTLAIQADLGALYCESGRFAEAIPLLQEVQRKVHDGPRWTWVGDALRRAGQAADTND